MIALFQDGGHSVAKCQPPLLIFCKEEFLEGSRRPGSHATCPLPSLQTDRHLHSLFSKSLLPSKISTITLPSVYSLAFFQADFYLIIFLIILTDAF